MQAGRQAGKQTTRRWTVQPGGGGGEWHIHVRAMRRSADRSQPAPASRCLGRTRTVTGLKARHLPLHTLQPQPPLRHNLMCIERTPPAARRLRPWGWIQQIASLPPPPPKLEPKTELHVMLPLQPNEERRAWLPPRVPPPGAVRTAPVPPGHGVVPGAGPPRQDHCCGSSGKDAGVHVRRCWY